MKIEVWSPSPFSWKSEANFNLLHSFLLEVDLRLTHIYIYIEKTYTNYSKRISRNINIIN